MAKWMRCTRKSDSTPIYIHLDMVRWLRWNDEENFTVISWANGEENIVRVLEHPEEIFEAHGNKE
jgi:hypothetical protein